MSEEEFQQVARDREIIAVALRALADTGADPSMTARASKLAERFRPIIYKQFLRASRYLAREALNDAESSTSVLHEMELLAKRALEFEAAGSVEDLARRKLT